MLSILADPILPVFAIAALGFLMGRFGVTSPEDARQINRIVMTVFLPMMVFGVIAQAPVQDFALLPTAIYMLAEALVYGLGFWLAYRVFRRGARESVLLAFSGIFGNTVLYILPIAILLYGRDDILPVTTIITLDSVVTFALALMALQLMEYGRISPGTVLLTVVRTPMLIAILAGIAFGATQATLPGPVRTFLDFNGAAAPPVALFALGVVLAKTDFRPDGTVAAFTLIKLAVFPAVVALGLWASVGLLEEHDLFLLSAAAPAGAMALSMALLHGVRTDAIAQVMVYTSVFTLFTLAWLA